MKYLKPYSLSIIEFNNNKIKILFTLTKFQQQINSTKNECSTINAQSKGVQNTRHKTDEVSCTLKKVDNIKDQGIKDMDAHQVLK